MAMRPWSVALVGLSLAAVGLGAAQSSLTKQDADRFQGKLSRIASFANAPKPKTATGSTAAAAPSTQTTQLTDAELNAYLHYHLKEQIPTGVVEPALHAVGDGRVKGSATIDLDAVRNQKQRGWTDPMAYLTGRMPLTASGLLITQNGVGRFQLESAEISGITIPKSLLQELVSYYSKSAERPSGVSMDDPFELPARIKEIRVGRGEAMVVQ
jgi:hypothetical protein